MADPKPLTIVDSAARRPVLDIPEIVAYRGMIWALIQREITIRYKQALIGFAWIVIQPVISTIIFTLLFGVIARFPSGDAPYPVFVLIGVLFWSYFAKVTNDGSNCLLANRGMITKVYFPRIIIPLSHVLEALVDFVVVLAILVVVMAAYGRPPSLNIVFLPLFMLVAMAFGFGLACFTGALNVMYRDIKFLVMFGLQIGFFATPVVYPVSFVPAGWTWVLALNPMSLVIEGARWSLLGTGSLPRATDCALSLAVAAAALVLGVWYFRHVEGKFADSI